MSSARHERIGEIFLRVRDLPVEERDRELRRACRDDAGLRAEVESLLEADADAPTLEDPMRMADALEAVAASLSSSDARSGPRRDDPSSLTGRTMAHFEIVGELGRGGMGVVYRARDTRLNRYVAVKTLPAEMFAHPERRARFEREARMVAALNHPNIVTLHSVEECDGMSFLTMELVDGQQLSELIPSSGFSLSRFLEIAEPLAEAVSFAHRSGITHRDLKPANVMITTEGRLKVLDFGLAKQADLRASESADEMGEYAITASMTGEGLILGTVPYMSPEQAEGKPVDARSDVFSLGIVLYEMATGRRPFDGDSVAAQIGSILRDTPPELADIDPTLPASLGRIMKRCLEKTPAGRYSSAREVYEELVAVRDDVESGGAPPSGFSLQWKTMVGGGIVFALLTLTVLAILGFRPFATADPDAESTAQARTNSIAVLPFANRSGDPDNEYFSDGLAEELLNVLARLQGLHVAARTSSFHFKGYTGDIAEIGRQLNVATILEGSVRRAGDEVRVTAQLINAADGFQLWSQTYERQLDDIFAIQEDIAAEVVGALRVTLLGEDALQLKKRFTKNIAAYDAYLLGQQRMARRRSDSLREAVGYFEKAIELDPDYPLAYVGLAEATVHLSSGGLIDDREALARAESLIEEAMKLDGQLGEAYAILGLIRSEENRIDEAKRAYERAIELSPGYAMTYMWYGNDTSDPERALELYSRALDLDPLSTIVLSNLGNTLTFGLHRIEEGLERFHRIIEIDPGFAHGYARIGTTYRVKLYQLEEAREWFQKAIEVDPGDALMRWFLADVFQELGRFDDAIGVWRSMIETDPALARSPAVFRGLAGVYQYFGHFEDAKEVWHRAMAAEPQSAEPYKGIAEVYRELGRLDEAVRCYHEAWKRDPTDYNTASTLTSLYLILDDEISARRWWERCMELRPESAHADEFQLRLNFRQSIAEYDAQLRELAARSRDKLRYAEELSFVDRIAGRYEDARERYAQWSPDLLTEDDPTVHGVNLQGAVEIAEVLLKSGDRGRGELLLKKCAAFIDSRSEGVRRANHRLDAVRIYALQGRKDHALAALRWAIDQQWRGDCRILELDPSLASLADDPSFEAMLAEVRSDLRQQRLELAAEGLATS